MSYVGRFAPSPTGPLHYGSLVAGLASYLDARHAEGKWLLRIEDLDPPRELASAPAEIMSQLESYALNWDDEVLFQGTRLQAYDSALDQLAQQHLTFPCTCARNSTPPIYPGQCRSNTFSAMTEPFATRLQVDNKLVSIEDLVFGHQQWNLKEEVGDFIIRRKDGLHAYQLAVVVDDDFQEVSRIVRGADLLSSTPRQLALYSALQLPEPEYLHVPIITDRSGNKLSKQGHAKPISGEHQIDVLKAALTDLGQQAPAHYQKPADLLKSAVDSWDINRIPKVHEIEAPTGY